MTLAELGAKLRETREGRGMAVADVVNKLKIPTRILQGIEEGSNSLPRTVYVHHFIKEYALLLGFSAQEVAEWLKNLDGFENVARPAMAENAAYTSVKPSMVPMILGGVFKAVFVLALACGAYMAWLHFFAGRDYETPSVVSGEQSAPEAQIPTWGNAASSTAQLPAPVQSLPQSEPAHDAEEADQAAPTQSYPSEAAEQQSEALASFGAQEQQNEAPVFSGTPEQQSEQASPPAAEAVSPQNPNAPVVLPEGLHQVEVIADAGDCWMGFEPDGKNQQRTLRKGDTFSMTFRDSLIIRLGNARAVRVVYDGKELDRSTSVRVVTMRFPSAQ